WAPVRWCLFVTPRHGFAGSEMTLEAVLANEGVLPPGEYAVRLRVAGPSGVVWEKSTRLQIPHAPALAVPVLLETVALDAPAGEYTFAATLDEGGYAAGGRLRFHLANPVGACLRGTAATYGVGESAQTWLRARGLDCAPFVGAERHALVIVGSPPGPDVEPAAWDTLQAHLSAGGTVLCLSAEPFRDHAPAFAWLPIAQKGRCYRFNDWLYHKECVVKRHPVFAGLHGPGVMDWEFFGPLIPRDMFEGMATPDETLAAAFATGHHQAPGGYACGLLIAAYRVGSGRLILSTLPILDNLGIHPAADQLLVNLLGYAQ
ncbi:MAG: hypothetical protein ACRC1H_00385, partial [Caldilineaceae bacterium]